mmetsp:Transcript_29126/g.60936  ORF Transcript_29126/g.60936 Transcript_29126/m.60936 type:complete len:85 (+) Transcript_29126:960-1214(+)
MSTAARTQIMLQERKPTEDRDLFQTSTYGTVNSSHKKKLRRKRSTENMASMKCVEDPRCCIETLSELCLKYELREETNNPCIND